MEMTEDQLQELRRLYRLTSWEANGQTIKGTWFEDIKRETPPSAIICVEGGRLIGVYPYCRRETEDPEETETAAVALADLLNLVEEIVER